MNDQDEHKCYVNVFPLRDRDLPFVIGQLVEAAATKGAVFCSVWHLPEEERVRNTPGAWLKFSWLEYEDYLEVVDEFIKRLDEWLPEVEVWTFHNFHSRSERLKRFAEEEADNG